MLIGRFKQQEVKIQAWENHEKRKAEMEMKRMEVTFSYYIFWLDVLHNSVTSQKITRSVAILQCG